MSWLQVAGGFDLLCNRDESRSRKPASPPEIAELRGVRYIAPTDGDFGGTWIGVNERGLAVCLLNRYGTAPAVDPASWTSRGAIVRDLMDGWGRLMVRERLGAIDLTQYRPFTLVALYPGEPALVARWTGRSCLFEYDGEYGMPLVSSAVDPIGVEESRRRVLAEMAGETGLKPDALIRFHRSHSPEASAYSVCMHRDDAETVSLSHVRVRRDRVEFDYVAGAPCSGAAMDPTILSRTTDCVGR